MRTDITGNIEGSVREISNDLNISGTIIVQFCMEMLFENIAPEDIRKLIKCHIVKAVNDHRAQNKCLSHGCKLDKIRSTML